MSTTAEERKDMIARIPAAAYMGGNGKWQGVRRDVHLLIADVERLEGERDEAVKGHAVVNEHNQRLAAKLKELRGERDEAVKLLRYEGCCTCIGPLDNDESAQPPPCPRCTLLDKLKGAQR